jgi:hypothetical protein
MGGLAVHRRLGSLWKSDCAELIQRSLSSASFCDLVGGIPPFPAGASHGGILGVELLESR